MANHFLQTIEKGQKMPKPVMARSTENPLESIIFYDTQIRKQGIKTGKYQHFKGKEYEVMGTAQMMSTVYVVYKALYKDKEFGKNAIWARPLEMFKGYVNREGKRLKRFKYVGKNS